MAEFSGTHFLFKKKPTRRPAFRVDADGWYSRIPPEPPEPPRPPAPPAPPSPPAPPAPPVPPAPPAPGPMSPQLTGNQPVLTLLLPSAFDEYLSEPESNKAPDEYVEVEHFPGGRWGQPDDCPWDESAVGADDDVADAEEARGADGAEGGTEASAGGGTAEDVFPEGVTGDDDDDGVDNASGTAAATAAAAAAAEIPISISILVTAVPITAAAFLHIVEFFICFCCQNIIVFPRRTVPRRATAVFPPACARLEAARAANQGDRTGSIFGAKRSNASHPRIGRGEGFRGGGGGGGNGGRGECGDRGRGRNGERGEEGEERGAVVRGEKEEVSLD
ncbi:unnamed protein product [Closterium sp. NIES-53]